MNTFYLNALFVSYCNLAYVITNFTLLSSYKNKHHKDTLFKAKTSHKKS
jgi:hypothetical protein